MEYVSEDPRGTEDLNAADLKADIYYLAAMRRHPLTRQYPPGAVFRRVVQNWQGGRSLLCPRDEKLCCWERAEQQGKLFPNSGAAAITEGKKNNYKQAAKKRSRFDLKRKTSV